MDTSQKKLVVDEVTRSAAHLSLIEIAIGSIVHAWHIPLGGHLLSLNQGAFFCQHSNESQTRLESSRRAIEISGVAAALKSLSPAGQKLGPMLSLSMQGGLYGLGNLIAGRKILGQMLGMILLSLWAFVQPFITIWISFGSNNLTALFEAYQHRMSPEFSFWSGIFLYGLLTVIAIKITMSALVPITVQLVGKKRINEINERLTAIAANHTFPPRRKTQSAFRGAVHDMTRPLFLLSLALMIVFWSIREPSVSRVVWLSLRPIAIAFLIFYLLRSHWFLNGLSRLAKHSGVMRKFENRVRGSYAYMNSLTSKIG